MTLDAHLDSFIQRHENSCAEKNTMIGMLGPSNSRLKRVLEDLEEDILENSRRRLLEALRSALRRSQRDCGVLIRASSELYPVHKGDIHDSTKP